MNKFKPSIKEIFFEVCDSTQIYARNNDYKFLQENKQWYLIRSNQQTSGIGQSNRNWVSPPDNIYATFIIPLEFSDFIFLHYFPFIAAKSVSQTLNRIGLKTKIKWINDILVNDKKISGVLVESVSQGDDLWALIGIGININATRDNLLIVDQAATSVSIEKEVNFTKLEISEIVSNLKELLYENIQTIRQEHNGLKDLIKYLKSNIAYVGKIVKIADSEDKSKGNIGIFKGITDEGHLRLYDGIEETLFIKGRMFLVRNSLVGEWKSEEPNHMQSILCIEADNIKSLKGYYLTYDDDWNKVFADIDGNFSELTPVNCLEFIFNGRKANIGDINWMYNSITWNGKYDCVNDEIIIESVLFNFKNLEEKRVYRNKKEVLRRTKI